jgi:hypothetical protein
VSQFLNITVAGRKIDLHYLLLEIVMIRGIIDFMFFFLNYISEWNDRCNRYNQLCPKLVQVAPPQQVVVVPQPQVVAVPQQVVAVPQQVVPQQVIVQQPAPQKIKFKLFG